VTNNEMNRLQIGSWIAIAMMSLLMLFVIFQDRLGAYQVFWKVVIPFSAFSFWILAMSMGFISRMNQRKQARGAEESARRKKE